MKLIFSKISNDIWNVFVHLVEVSVIIGYYYNNRIKGNETNFSSYTGTNWNFYDIDMMFWLKHFLSLPQQHINTCVYIHILSKYFEGPLVARHFNCYLSVSGDWIQLTCILYIHSIQSLVYMYRLYTRTHVKRI